VPDDPRPHVEVPVKVTAMVDQGIAGLVAHLNTYEGVQSFSCCQGHDEEYQSAYVWFEYRGPRPVLEFYAWFAATLRAAVMPHGEYRFEVVWESHSPEPTAFLRMPPSTIPVVERALWHATPFET